MKIKTIIFVAAATLASYACKKQRINQSNFAVNSRVGGLNLPEADFVMYKNVLPVYSTMDLKVFVDVPDALPMAFGLPYPGGNPAAGDIMRIDIPSDRLKIIYEDVMKFYREEFGINMQFVNSFEEAMQDPANSLVIRLVKNEYYQADGSMLIDGAFHKNNAFFGWGPSAEKGLPNRIYMNIHAETYNENMVVRDAETGATSEFMDILNKELDVNSIETGVRLIESSLKDVLAHETGHILGLYHTEQAIRNGADVFPKGAAGDINGKYPGLMSDGSRELKNKLINENPEYIIDRVKNGKPMTDFSQAEKNFIVKLKTEDLPRLNELRAMEADLSKGGLSFRERLKKSVDFNMNQPKNPLFPEKSSDFPKVFENTNNLQKFKIFEDNAANMTNKDMNNALKEIEEDSEAMSYLGECTKLRASCLLPKLSNEVKARGVEADYVQGVAKKLDASSLEFENFYFSLLSEDGQTVSKEGMKSVQYFKDLCTRESSFFDKSLLSDMNNIIDNVMENTGLVFDKELKTIINKMNGLELKYPEANIFYQDLEDYLKVRYEGNIPAGLGEQGFDDLMRASFKEDASIMQLLLKKI